MPTGGTVDAAGVVSVASVVGLLFWFFVISLVHILLF